jgi:maltooligosyltrehalose trehalohydrolase
MRRREEGWWQAEVETARPGSDYGFVLDGEGPFPDPRSGFQPHGVNGLSRIVDHPKFSWADADWKAPPLSSAVIYEMHVGTFTPAGTFVGALEKLDHLVKLGVTHIELMPVNEFSGAHGWGYDGVDLFAPHHEYGSPEELKEFVNACHARRMAVILDVVYNHLGPAGNHLGKFAPYFTGRYTSPWGPAVNFDDADSTQVRRFFCDNALMWLKDYHSDGLRLDAVHAIIDTSAQPFLEQLAQEVKQLEATLGRGLCLIAESDLNDPRLLRPSECGGLGLDAQWSDDFHHALHTVLTGEQSGYYEDFGTLAGLGKALRQAFVYDGNYSVHRRRNHGRPPGRLSGHRFLAYLQNHDQVGNRATGDRSSQLMSPGRLKIGAAIVLTSPFVPMLFQGEEWGASTPFQYFTDHTDPKLGEAVRQGRRREFAAFGWAPEQVPDPQSRETFHRSKLNWSELEDSKHQDLLNWHSRLIELRRSEPALTDGQMDKLRFQWDEEARWFVVERGAVGIFCNLAKEPQGLPCAGFNHLLLASEPTLRIHEGRIPMPSDSVAILKS